MKIERVGFRTPSLKNILRQKNPCFLWFQLIQMQTIVSETKLPNLAQVNLVEVRKK